MAKTKISEFSSTPGNNTDIDGINIAEGCAPSGINNAIRELMSQLKDFQAGTAGDSFNGPVGTSTAAAGAFTTLTTSSTVTHNAGTVNGVAYLNGSKVLTTGSALTFDGTNFTAPRTQFTTSGSPPASGAGLEILGGTSPLLFAYNRGTSAYLPLNATASAFGWSLSGSDAMILTSTGLGIGTSSPGARLHIASATTDDGLRIQNTSTANSTAKTTRVAFYGTDTGSSVKEAANIYTLPENANYINTALTFQTRRDDVVAERMRLDSSGNLGLGVTPSAWGANNPAIQMGGTNQSSYVGTFATTFGTNAYFDGSGWRYIQTGGASALYNQPYAGGHRWFTAPSGTAGNAISFTQAMTLDASGNLGVGTTSPGNRLHVTGSNGDVVRFAGATKNLYLSLDTSGYGLLSGANQTGAGFYVHDTSSYVSILTSSTERARIDSSGNLLLSTTSQFGSGKLSVSYLGASQQGINIRDGSNQSGSAYMVFGSSGGTTQGTITNSGGTGVAYNTSSDYRLKENPQPLTGSGVFIDALQPKTWDWKVDGSKGVGFLAHEAQAVSPSSVTGEKDAVDEEGKPVMQAMEYGSAEFIANIIAELQSLRKRVAELEAK